MERSRLKNKIRNQKKKNLNFKIKSYLKEIPESCKKVLGDGYVLFPVNGDGSCGPRCASAWIFQDPSLGPYLARNINMHFIKNWDYWKEIFVFPFERDVGNGKVVRCDNQEELFEFLINSEESAYMWRGHEDFSAVSSAYQFNIKIITIDNDADPVVNIIEPNPALIGVNELPAGKIPDMVLLHEKDSHYNLVIPENSRLALEGGLDFQRKKEIDRIGLSEEVMTDVSENTLELRITALEKKCKDLESKVTSLEAENRMLRKSAKEMPADKDKNVGVLEAEILLTNKLNGFRRGSPQEQPEVKKPQNDFPCEECDYKLESLGLLQAHMKIHVEKNYPFECEECGKEFVSKKKLENHMEYHHKKCEEPAQTDQTSRQYNCEDCPFQGENGLELKKHIVRTKHSPSEYCEKCYTCKKEFSSYWHLMNHRKMEHPSNKKCRYYLNEMCRFDAETCWYKHEAESMENVQESSSIENSCKDCGKTFLSKSDMMKHRKSEHKSKVSRCRDFLQERCNLSENACWYSHDEKENEVKDHKSDEQEPDFQNSGFHRVQEKTPPDQMGKIMTLINKLSLQVELLEKKSMKINLD